MPHRGRRPFDLISLAENPIWNLESNDLHNGEGQPLWFTPTGEEGLVFRQGLFRQVTLVRRPDFPVPGPRGPSFHASAAILRPGLLLGWQATVLPSPLTL